MAQWIAEYPLNIPCGTPAASYSGMIGDELWIVNRIVHFEIEMFLFNINLKQWVKVNFNSDQYIQDYIASEEEEEDEGDEAIEVSITNNKIYMLRNNYTRTEQLFEFDREGLKWKLLKTFDNFFNLRQLSVDFIVLNNKMYTLSYSGDDVKFKVFCMDTFELIHDGFRIKEDTSVLHEYNGVLYIYGTEVVTHRNMILYSIDAKSCRLVKLNEKTNEYKKVREFLFVKDNCIYLVYVLDNKMKMECFDIDKKVWADGTTLDFDIDNEIVNVYEKNGKVYVLYRSVDEDGYDTPVSGIRVLDLNPKLSTICSLAIARDTPKEDVHRRKRKLPVEIGYQLDDALSIQSYILPKIARLEIDDSSEETLNKKPVVVPEPMSLYQRFKQFLCSFF